MRKNPHMTRLVCRHGFLILVNCLWLDRTWAWCTSSPSSFLVTKTTNTFQNPHLSKSTTAATSTTTRSRKALQSSSTLFLNRDQSHEHDLTNSDLSKSSSSSSSTSSSLRRYMLAQLLASPIVYACSSKENYNAVAAVTQAVGSGESKCRQAGNCLEIGELDGALGWNWGGADRCDPSDFRCGPDGKLREAIIGKPVPDAADRVITHVVAMQVEIGRQGEVGVLKLGLFGKDCPGSVQQLVDFLSSESGLFTLEKKPDMLGLQYAPVAIARGGIVDYIVPSLIVDFGVPSQGYSYARSKGSSRISENFVPQPRPKPSDVANDNVVRSHDVAGLLSVSNKGLGYGGTGFESDDEAYGSSFLITAGSMASLDKTRRVVGQVLDGESMAFLERLATLPTKKGIKGVIPGQLSGPPLLKAVVRNVQVATVTPRPN